MKIKSTLLCIVLAICLSKTTVLRAQVNVQDSLALVDLYNSTDGPHWLYNNNWLTSVLVSQWYGITTDNSKVIAINLPSEHLNGLIPASIGNLSNLQTLNLAANHLTGIIPSSIGNLGDLQFLYLNYNRLVGSIPSELGNLKNLVFLHLDNNQLSGSIPPELGSQNIGDLNLNHNQLSGSIPPELGNLINLSALNLSNNQLSGSIPPELGKPLYLYNLLLSNNQLTGKIPPELGNYPLLNTLFLGMNQLSGNIPPELGNLVNLTSLYLSNNLLTGNIPASFGKLKTLFDLRLNNNKLTGPISSGIGNLRHLDYLYLDHNRLSGDISSNIVNIPFDCLVKIGYNHFTYNGIELVAKKFHTSVYSPQALINIHITGDSLSLSAGGTLSNNTYKWFRVGQTDSTVILGDSVFYPSQSGQYYATISNAIATQLTLKTDTITYTAPAVFNISSSTNNFQSSNKANAFSIHPNPAKDILHIQTNGSASYSLINEAGRILLTKNITGNASINISGFAAGLYYLKNNSSGAVQKVIISR